MVHGLSCPTVCGICLDQGQKLCPLHWQEDSFFFFFFMTKQDTFIGKGSPGRKQEGKGTQKDCSALWLAVSRFMVMRLVLGCLFNHSDSGSFLMVHALSIQDGCQ